MKRIKSIFLNNKEIIFILSAIQHTLDVIASDSEIKIEYNLTEKELNDLKERLKYEKQE